MQTPQEQLQQFRALPDHDYDLAAMLEVDDVLVGLGFELDHLQEYIDHNKLIQLLEYICTIDHQAGETRKYMYPTLSCQILCMESNHLLDLMVRQSFLQQMVGYLKGGLNELQVAMLVSIWTHLYQHRGPEVLCVFMDGQWHQVLVQYMCNRSVAMFLQKLMVHNHFGYDYIDERVMVVDAMFQYMHQVHQHQHQEDKAYTLVDNIQMILQEMLQYNLEYVGSQHLQQRILTHQEYYKILEHIIQDIHSKGYLIQSAVYTIAHMQNYYEKQQEQKRRQEEQEIKKKEEEEEIKKEEEEEEEEKEKQEEEEKEEKEQEEKEEGIEYKDVQMGCVGQYKDSLLGVAMTRLQETILNNSDGHFGLGNLWLVELIENSNRFQLEVYQTMLGGECYGLLVDLLFHFKTNSILHHKIYQIMHTTLTHPTLNQQNMLHFLDKTQLLHRVVQQCLSGEQGIVRENHTNSVLMVVNLVVQQCPGIVHPDLEVVQTQFMGVMNEEQKWAEPMEEKQVVSNEVVGKCKYNAKQNYNDFFDDLDEIEVGSESYPSNDSLCKEYVSNRG